VSNKKNRRREKMYQGRIPEPTHEIGTSDPAPDRPTGTPYVFGNTIVVPELTLEQRIVKLEKMVKLLQTELNFHTHSAPDKSRSGY